MTFNIKNRKTPGNTIYLSDDEDTLYKKVMSVYTDPNHIHVEDPGNIVFTYLDIFGKDKATIQDLKGHYKRGGLGDVKLKKYLFGVLNDVLKPIRERRIEYSKDIPAVYEMLHEGCRKANKVAAQTLNEVKQVMGINYFN